MEKTIRFSIEHKDIVQNINKEHKLDLIVERLKPFEQLNLILKIISIIAKGHSTNSAQVEQALHNIFQTGKEINDANKEKSELSSLRLIIDAIKGALAELSDKDRDWLISELLKNVKIDAGQSYIVAANQEELNSRCTSFQPIFKLLAQLVKINLGFL